MFNQSICFSLLLLSIFLTGCSSFKSWFSKDNNSPTQSANIEQQLGTSLADQDLKRILKKQEKLFALLTKAEGEESISSDNQRLAEELVSHYKSLTNNYPEYVYGYILYGKFLRQVGQNESANKIFLKANELDPNIAVVKQQIGNYLSEEGLYELALPYFMSAIDLEPETALYHFQLGELIYQYHDLYLAEGKIERDVLQNQMLKAFGNAARLEPNNRNFQMRYAETFFDIDFPDWSKALALWNKLEASVVDDTERDVIKLQKAHVLIEMNRFDEAETIVHTVDRASLEGTKQMLLDGIASLR